MDFKIARKLDYDLSRVIHVGAHKFEESNEYDEYGTVEVFWIDPLPQVTPENLPKNQKFLAIAIDNVSTKSTRNFKIYDATGFSSFFELDRQGSLLRGTPSDIRTVTVEVESLRNLITENNLLKFSTLVVDTQGSELEILKSADLEQFSEVIVETSRIPLYQNESRHSEINKLMSESGFFHNFNSSDFIYAHGDQYYSRNTFKPLRLQFVKRLQQTFRFVRSFFSRVRTAIMIRVKDSF